MATTKKISIKYWNTLSKGSKERALRACYPNADGIVKMMLEQKPDLKDFFWKRAFSMIKIPDNYYYKTCVNRVYYP